MVRRAEQPGRRGGHLTWFEPRRLKGKVSARLKERRVEQLLQLEHRERVDAVVGRKKGGDERDAQVRHRQVAQQQLGIVLAKRAPGRGGRVLAKIR